MANSKHLEGLRCPQCGSYEPFCITVITSLLFFDDTWEEDPMHGTPDIDRHENCSCVACDFGGTVNDFTIKETP